MIELTPDARKRFDDYLQRTRSALRGTRPVIKRPSTGATSGALHLMVITFPIGGVLLLPLAFVLSRACVALLRERGERLGAKAWLVLPPIVFALLLFAGGALILGGAAAGVFAAEQGMQELGFPEPANRADLLRMSIGLVSFSAGVWWIVLSGLFALLFAPIRSLFMPVLDRMKRGHLAVLAGIGMIAAGAGAVLLWVV